MWSRILVHYKTKTYCISPDKANDASEREAIAVKISGDFVPK